ncbi:MAG: BREX system P-loop protein BrxC [Chloroflexi bacterium]|nr:BREX system P-loop protein BrxC [Chloroflexota bacterium]
MQIRSLFATTVQERIDPIVKVADRRPTVVGPELLNLVVTPQWERYLHTILDAYINAATNDEEEGIAIWISGFFGSGKSLLMKVLGVLLESSEVQGQSAHNILLNRLPANSPYRNDLKRFLNIAGSRLSATAVGGNLHSMLSDSDDTLALIAFKLFAAYRDYTHHWPLAWAVEYQLDERGLSEAFHQHAEELTGEIWQDVAEDPEFYLEDLYAAAAKVLPGHFDSAADVERSVSAMMRSGVTPQRLIRRLRRWCEARDDGKRRHKLLLQLDEVGQWINSGNAYERTMQVQALVEEAAQNGSGRLWVAVTAHGDVQALKQNVQQEYYAKIIQRFALQCKLSNDDINQVVEERVLRKTQNGRRELERRFEARSGELTDLGSLEQTQRVYPLPDTKNFPLFYPFMPWTVSIVPDVVKGIAQAAGRDEALTGSNRTMIAVVQGALIETAGFLEQQVGHLLGLADLYPQLASDVPVETKTDINRISDTVPHATDFTTRVAQGLFLLGQGQYVPCNLTNISRAVVDNLDANLVALKNQVKPELDRLVETGYAKRVGDHYVFLSTQQRTFQDKVRSRQEQLLGQTYELSLALKNYESDDAFRFDRVAIQDRELPLRFELDGRLVRNPGAQAILRVSSPLQRTLDPQVGDDTAMRQISNSARDTTLFRMADVSGLRATLALTAATEVVANEVLSSRQADPAEEEVARQAKQTDLAALKEEVRRMLGQSIREGVIFFRGSIYQLAGGESARESVRATLSQILPSIYPRFGEVPQRISNEATAVKAALSDNSSNSDLRALGVYAADGTLNESHPLISALRGRLPLAEQDQQPINADELRSEFERPPYGWDGNGIKVGLALLVRASACRLIDSGQVFTDPSDPHVADLLSKETRFKNLRVQGVRSDLSMPELIEIRQWMEAIFGVKPALVASTLSNTLGEQMNGLAGQAQTMQTWTGLTQCPLPVTFESGTSLVHDILNTGAVSVRLATFMEQAERLRDYVDLLQALTQFKDEHGNQFSQMRNFYQSMVNVTADITPLRQFIQDYRTVLNERSLTQPERWNELVQAYHAAQQAVTDQIAQWQTQARQQVADLEPALEAQVLEAGVPNEAVAEETERLLQVYENVRLQSERPNPTFYEAQGLLSSLTSAELARNDLLREMRYRYKPTPPPDEHHLRWSELAGRVSIQSEDDLEAVLDDLRSRIAGHFDGDITIIIE